jgi:hypothetical protein
MIRVYKYGLLPPTTNTDIVSHAIRRGHRYQNELVESERRIRAEFAEGRVKICPRLQELENDVVSTLASIESIDTAFKSNTAEPGSLERKRVLRKELKTLRTEIKTLKVELKRDGRLDALRVSTNEQRKLETKTGLRPHDSI